MKTRVDPGLCQGHTICSMVAPEIYVLDDEDGHATAVDGDVPADLIEKVHEAVRSCPERAIAETA